MKLFSFGRHFSVSSSTFDANLIRNIGIIAHIDAGKTTTTEKLIYKTGLIKRAGSVDNGDTVMDYLPEERERGITITSAAITLPWRGHRLNLIDTPGHVDFTVEVERSLRVMDAVIVILDASKGVQAQTLTVWRQAQRYGLKSLVFINKMDKVGVDLEKCLKDIQTNFGLAPMLLSEPVMERDEIKGTRLVSGADGLFESVAQFDDEFLEKYLNDVIEPSDCKNAIARITAKGREAIAVLVGASARDIGTENLLDAIVDYLPPPVVKSAVNSNNFKALAFKVVYDQQRNGFLVYCRVYSGEFNSKKKPTLYNLNQKRREQVGKVMQVMADELIEIEGAQVAQVVILTGLKHTATGDTLCDSEDSAEILEGIAIPSPVISVSLEAESPGVQDHLDKCLKTLQLEDPSLRVKTDKATGQTVLSGMGELHLEIAVESRLRKVMKAQFTTGPIAIAYLESLEFFEGEIMKRSHIVERDIFGIKLKGSVDLEIRKSDTFGIEFPARYVNDENVKKSIEDGVYGALGRGPIGGHAVDRNFIVRIENLEFETVNSAHVVVYESLQLLLKAAHSTGKLILKEPLVQVEIDSPEQFIGDLTTDLFSQRRCVDCETVTTTSEDESSTTIRIKARAPLKRMLGYSNWQRSRTGGLASFTMEACGYTATCDLLPCHRLKMMQGIGVSMSLANRLKAPHLEHFRKLLGGTNFVLSRSNGEDLSAYLTDWTGKFGARPEEEEFIVLKPGNTQQVSDILKFCNEQRIGVIPQGGNTGLVGGSVPCAASPYQSPVILSLSRLNGIESVDRTSGVVKMGSGCILEQVDRKCREEAGLMIPIDLGAKGSCQIGGILATNAGGIRLLRYGSLHGSCLGLEVVLADGRILKDMRGLRKDNTGYDLKQIFIGSEGTLGVITAAAIQAVPQPTVTNLACFQLDTFKAVQEVFRAARESLGEILSAYEFWDGQCENLLQSHQGKLFEGSGDFYVLIETGGSDAAHDQEKLTKFLEKVMNESLVLDGILAQDQKQQESIWSRREGIPEACSKIPGKQVHKFDLSFPADSYYSLVPLLKERSGNGEIEVFGFGHVGDGNIHINLVAPKDAIESIKEISQFIFEWTASAGGSVSAEHGIGQAKREHLNKSRSPIEIELMKSLKNLLDPNGILNPGKVL